MQNSTRLLLEIAGVALAIAAVVVTWWSGEHQQRTQLAEVQTRHVAELQAVEERAIETRDRLVMREAEAVIKAFSAGVHPAIMANRTESVDAAVVDLIQIPEVVFAHVATPQGVVIASSDRKLVGTGNLGERGSWALAATDLQTRPGDADGTVELAMSLSANSGWHVVVWLGYNVKAAGAAADEH